jgi:hypothetical protein
MELSREVRNWPLDVPGVHFRLVRMQYKSPVVRSLQSNLSLQHFEAAHRSHLRLLDQAVRPFLCPSVPPNCAPPRCGNWASALLFLYHNVLGRSLEALGTGVRARRTGWV